MENPFIFKLNKTKYQNATCQNIRIMSLGLVHTPTCKKWRRRKWRKGGRRVLNGARTHCYACWQCLELVCVYEWAYAVYVVIVLSRLDYWDWRVIPTSGQTTDRRFMSLIERLLVFRWIKLVAFPKLTEEMQRIRIFSPS